MTNQSSPVDRRILVIDDDPGVRLTIRWALEDEGLIVETAADGPEAVDRLGRAQPRLAVVDMGLPTLNGDAVASELRARYGNSVPILLITADGQAAEKALRVGAFDYLHKPFEIDDLVAAVKQGLTSG